MNVPARDAAGYSPDLGRPAQLKESGSAGYTRALHPHTHSTPLFGPAANLTPSATSRRRRSNRSGPHSRPAPRRGRPLPWTSKLPTRAPPAARPALNCQPGRPHRTARDYPVQHSRPYYRTTPARRSRGYVCPAQPQPRQLLGPGGPRRHQLPSGALAVSGGWSSHGPQTCSQPAAGPRARQQTCPASTPAAGSAGRRLTARHRHWTHPAAPCTPVRGPACRERDTGAGLPAVTSGGSPQLLGRLQLPCCASVGHWRGPACPERSLPATPENLVITDNNLHATASCVGLESSFRVLSSLVCSR